MGLKNIQGITFPFGFSNNENYYLDVDKNYFKSIKSKLQHLLLTEKGQKIRDPEFGINLHEILFNQNDEITNDEIRAIITETVTKYIPNVIIKDFIIKEKGMNELKLMVNYSVLNDIYEYQDSFEIIIN